MTLPLGILTAVTTLGLQALTVTPSRYIGAFTAQVTIEEQHVDEMEITEHPIETGSRITDHAYMRPAEVTIHCAWSNSPNINGNGGLGGLVSGALGSATATLGGLTSLANSAGAALGGLASSASTALSGAIGNLNGLSGSLTSAVGSVTSLASAAGSSIGNLLGPVGNLLGPAGNLASLGGLSSAVSSLGSIGNLGSLANLAGLGDSITSGINGALKSVGFSAIASNTGISQAAQVYENLLILQRYRVPFDIATGKRLYKNMLVKSLRVTTNKESENALDVTAIFRQLMIVQTKVVSVGAPAAAQAAPDVTSSLLDKGLKAAIPAATAALKDAISSISPVALLGPLGTSTLAAGLFADVKSGKILNGLANS